MEIIVDYRETKFIDNFKSNSNCCVQNEKGDISVIKLDENDCININKDKKNLNKLVNDKNDKKTEFILFVKNLPVGDFVIKKVDYDNNNSNQNDIIPESVELVIERKTYSDLFSSIVDGRFRQQKQRLIDSVINPKKILYIIEGDHKESRRLEYKNKIQTRGAIINLLYKHNFGVLQTENLQETVETVKLLCKKVYKREILITNTCENIQLHKQNGHDTSDKKFIRKSDYIKENIFVLQLSIIPGVSVKTAKIISQYYKNMKNLVDAYSHCKDEQEKVSLLSDIRISEKRKLGKSLSKKIYECVYL